jgi:uncharacterized protein YndB with AHSA1/START domain
VIDVQHQVNSVRRTVGNRTLEAGEARVITISQSYPTDADDLWDACTSADRLRRWFMPVSGDLTVGGTYQLERNAGGTIQTCEPPRRFTATWEYGGNVSWIELRIIEEGDDRARMELDHIAHVDDDMWPQFGPGAVGLGWDLALVGLAIHTATKAAIPPDFENQWVPSEDGKRFIRLAGEEWYRAQVTWGDDPAVARSAADNTIAAYLGEQQN